MVYRFKVTFEDHEDVYREIEIKSSQNYEDFHSIILKSIQFTGDHNASFFISDDYWRKGEEIVLRIVEDANKNKRNPDVPKRLMSKCKLAALIDDPHQKFVYVFDPKVQWSFLVELLKIVPDDAKATYPKCVKEVGIAPKNAVAPIIATAILDDDDLDDDDIPVDDDAYENAHCEDGIAELTGEEGEEEEAAEEVEEEMMDDDGDFEDLADEQFEED